MKVRKRPVVVDAWRISELLHLYEHTDELPPEILVAEAQGTIEFEKDRITIVTLEGVMTGWETWWLIKGVQGEWYPCDGAVFHDSYEEVVEDYGQWNKTVHHDITRATDPYHSNPEG